MRIGFLFNHDQIHQIVHSLPIAQALVDATSDSGGDVDVLVATTVGRLAVEVRRQLQKSGNSSRISHVQLTLKSRMSRLFAKLFGKILPASKLMLYGENLNFFKSLDALVVTERTSLILKGHFGLKKPIMILADHGAGDRAIGFGKVAAKFDHILAAGPKIRDRFERDAGVLPANISITGYPKFDVVRDDKASSLFPNSDAPIILYNPHLSPHLSSWYKEGRAVLDYFLDRPEYNLIFAPHIMLFQRRVVFTIDKFSIGFPGRIKPKFAAAANIHVDLGSVASTDMTYTDMADIYLGDASSQVYEFLRVLRPCIFLNPRKIAYAGNVNFTHWKAGQVIESASELDDALRDAPAKHVSYYKPIQQALFSNTFDFTDEPSSARGARAIMGLLKI
jgi:hypothetical protein